VFLDDVAVTGRQGIGTLGSPLAAGVTVNLVIPFITRTATQEFKPYGELFSGTTLPTTAEIIADYEASHPPAPREHRAIRAWLSDPRFTSRDALGKQVLAVFQHKVLDPLSFPLQVLDGYVLKPSATDPETFVWRAHVEDDNLVFDGVPFISGTPPYKKED
jgi:hypothetical protein